MGTHVSDKCFVTTLREQNIIISWIKPILGIDVFVHFFVGAQYIYAAPILTLPKFYENKNVLFRVNIFVPNLMGTINCINDTICVVKWYF